MEQYYNPTRKGSCYMQKSLLEGMRVAILVTNDFEQVELVEPKKALEQVGAETMIIAPEPGQVQGMNHDIKADTFKVDMTLNRADKPLAIICHAPWLLVSARLVIGRTLTSYHTIQDDIRNAGGKWVDQEVVRDHNWVSSRSPKDIPAFNQAVIALFAERKSPAMGQQHT